jgi:hypothetical protein
MRFGSALFVLSTSRVLGFSRLLDEVVSPLMLYVLWRAIGLELYSAGYLFQDAVSSMRFLFLAI